MEQDCQREGNISDLRINYMSVSQGIENHGRLATIIFRRIGDQGQCCFSADFSQMLANIID